jgi:hypothetical protein
MLDYFFHSEGYGGLSWMVKNDNFDSVFKLAKRNFSKEEIAKLTKQMKHDPVKTSEYIYEKGLLDNPKVFDKLTEIVSEDNIKK